MIYLFARVRQSQSFALCIVSFDFDFAESQFAFDFDFASSHFDFDFDFACKDANLLQTMARDYLAIPATAASSERLFSSGSLLVTDNRNRLSEKTIQACECLKDWISLDFQ